MIAKPEPPTRWYRQFWPWVLIALPASAVIASLITVGIAVRNSDSLVVDDYYKVGLAINRRLARDQAAARYAMAAQLRVLEDRVELRLEGTPAAIPERITLKLVHATRADQDRSLKLARVEGLSYTALLEPLPAGRWNLFLEADDWRLTGSLDGPGEATRLTPYGTGDRE